MPPGERYGALVIVQEIPPRYRHARRLIVDCDCGKRFEIDAGILRRRTRSCGCVLPHRKHGESGKRIPEYEAWKGMKDRCSNPNGEFWDAYGGRGIRVCERWIGSFPNFLADMGRRPTAMHSLDRKDVNGNYEPGNCRWATTGEQARNKRTNRMVTLHTGETMCMADVARKYGIDIVTLYCRIKRGVTGPALIAKAAPRKGRKVAA